MKAYLIITLYQGVYDGVEVFDSPAERDASLIARIRKEGKLHNAGWARYAKDEFILDKYYELEGWLDTKTEYRPEDIDVPLPQIVLGALEISRGWFFGFTNNKAVWVKHPAADMYTLLDRAVHELVKA